MEGDLASMTMSISIHAPTRGATGCVFYDLVNCGFQSTLPRGERPRLNPFPWKVLAFQSTLPRGERLNHRPSFYPFFYISIHAPTRGATHFLIVRPRPICDFNPRSHEGSDSVISKLLTVSFISIHAPTRGATIINVKYSGCAYYFNPRSHEGSD